MKLKYVYEIEIEAPLPSGLDLLEPIQEIARNAPPPTSPIPYHHDGAPRFLIGVIDPANNGNFLSFPRPQPLGGGTPRPANLSAELEAMVRALRDAEVLAVGNIPKDHVIKRIDVY